MKENIHNFQPLIKKDSLFKLSDNKVFLSENNIFIKNMSNNFKGDLCCLIKRNSLSKESFNLYLKNIIN